MARTQHPSRTALALFPLCVALVSGCYAEASTRSVASAEYVPAHVEIYPHDYYDGRTVYLIGDRWYYRDGGGWVYYRREPDVLVQRRVVIRQTPVVREHVVVHEAPPARVHRHHQHDHRDADPARRRAGRHAPSND